MSLALRPVSPQDDAFLSQLLLESFSEKLSAHLWPENVREPLLRLQIQGQRSTYAAQYPQADHAIIVLDEKPVGRILFDRGPQFHTLVDIVIAKKHRRAGMGTVLVRSLCIEAEMMRKPVRLNVAVDNPARALYLRLGFRMLEADEMNILMERAPGASPLTTA